MYEYLPIEDAKAGDVVECINPNLSSFTVGKLYILTSEYLSKNESLYTAFDDKGSSTNGFGNSRQCKLVKIKPGETAQVDETVMLVRQKEPNYYASGKIGMVETVTKKNGMNLVNKVSHFGWKPYDCVVLCKATQTPNEYGNPFKVGDRVRRIAEGNSDCEIGDKHIVTKIKGVAVYYKNTLSSPYRNWELVEESPPTEWVDRFLPTEKRNLAFYKRSGEPWTKAEYDNIQNYCGLCNDSSSITDSYSQTKKFIFDDGGSYNYMFMWYEQEEDPAFKNCTQVTYEDIFETAVATSCSQHDDIADAISYITPISEEETMNKSSLILLLEMMAAMSAKEVTDATNAKHIGILTESNGSYVGYVYANTLAELEDVVRTPANEGRTLHVFDYSTTLAQKPRKVVAIARTKE